MDTICQPAADRCRIISGLKGSAITSRIRSKYAMAYLRTGCRWRIASNLGSNFAPAPPQFKTFDNHGLDCAPDLSCVPPLTNFARKCSIPNIRCGDSGLQMSGAGYRMLKL